MAIKGLENLGNILNEYAKEVGDVFEQEAEVVAKASVLQLKATSPKRDKNGGAYAKGWRLKKIGTRFIIHNATNYQLTHLLEKGHVKRGGVGRVRAIPHIAPVEARAIQDLLDGIERRLS